MMSFVWLLLSLFLFLLQRKYNSQMAKQCCNTKNLTIILSNSLKRTQMANLHSIEYLSLLGHILMMHFGNGDKPNWLH